MHQRNTSCEYDTKIVREDSCGASSHSLTHHSWSMYQMFTMYPFLDEIMRKEFDAEPRLSHYRHLHGPVTDMYLAYSSRWDCAQEFYVQSLRLSHLLFLDRISEE